MSVARVALLIAAMAAGGSLWLHHGRAEQLYGPPRIALLLVAVGAVVAAAVPLKPRLPHLNRTWTAVLVGTAAFVLIGLKFHLDGGEPRPGVVDEYGYLIQSQMMALGRLWSPPHPHADFFTNYQFVAAPYYGGMYPVGTALWLLPWAGLDLIRAGGTGAATWPGPLLAASIAVGLTYRTAAELWDDRAGLAAAAVVVATPMFRSLATSFMGQPVVTMFVLACLFAYLRWRDAVRRKATKPALLWAATAGSAAAWAGVTRPADALAYALPIVLAVVLPATWRPAQRKLRLQSAAVAAAAMLPLAALQMAVNYGSLGDPLATPFSAYADAYLPGTGYDVTFAERPADAVPANATPDHQVSYREFARPFIADANAGPATVLVARTHKSLFYGTPHGLTLVFLPAAVLLLVLDPRRRRAARALAFTAGPVALAWLLYLPYGFYIDHYVVAIIPALATLAALGAAGLTRAAGASSRRGRMLFGASLVTAAVPVGMFMLDAPLGLPLVAALGAVALALPRDRQRAALVGGVLAYGALLSVALDGRRGLMVAGRDPVWQADDLRRIDAAVESLQPPALVFITPPPGDKPKEFNATFNLGVAYPDDAKIVRAHDLGVRNLELIRHYAERQPSRRVYHLDVRAMQATPLGTAADLAAEPAAARREFRERSAWWREWYESEIDRLDAAAGVSVPRLPIFEEHERLSQ